jgi:alpha/beta superfamily hydrolase
MKPIAAFTGPKTEADRTSIRSIVLRGPAGDLEAVLNEGASNPRFSALVCHPHPKGGGTMHNKVVYHAMKVLNAAEWGFRFPVLRFNFRGTGLSKGEHDGLSEAEDVTTALDWLHAEYSVPVIAAGFSFGASMAVRVCCGGDTGAKTQANVCALAAIGLPTQGLGQRFVYSYLAECGLPKLFLSGDADSFAPVKQLHAVVDSAADPKKLILISDSDHFFSGRLEAMQQAFAKWLKEQWQ